MAVKQSIGDKIAEKVLEGVEGVKNFANGGYKETGKNISEGAKTVGSTIAEGAKKAGTTIAGVAKKTGDFCVEKVFGREGETLEETKARIKRREFGVPAEKGDGEVEIVDASSEVKENLKDVAEEVKEVVSEDRSDNDDF